MSLGFIAMAEANTVIQPVTVVRQLAPRRVVIIPGLRVNLGRACELAAHINLCPIAHSQHRSVFPETQPAFYDHIAVSGGDLQPVDPPAQLFARNQLASTAAKWLVTQSAPLGVLAHCNRQSTPAAWA
jgi:hypothetical protein